MSGNKGKIRAWLPRAAAGVLVLGALLGMALAAGQEGSQSDPLVSLSYLEKKATPAILEQVDAKSAEQSKALVSQFDELIKSYTKQMEDKLAAAGGSGVQGAAFRVVDLAAGQRLNAGVGCEIMLRVGSAVCFSSSQPGLIDMTDGGSLENGKAMAKNHLYMATIDGRGVSAQDGVKLLVRGSYTIQ